MRNRKVLAISLVASIFLFGCNTTYTDIEAEEYVREELRSQFARYFKDPPSGAILIRPAPGKECVDANFDQCNDFYVRPLNETDQLFHIKPENLEFTLESSPPSEPQFSGFPFFYRWSCCRDEVVARGTAAFSPGDEVVLEGQTVDGEELNFSY